MSNFKVFIKDIAKHNAMVMYKMGIPKLFGVMTMEEQMKFATANYLVEYKLLLNKITKRLKVW